VEDLVGKKFAIDDADYAIVDVRDVDGVVMVYAEPVSGARGPGRAAFRYTDIQSQLDPSQVA
jgi:hypothetical protein